MTCHWPYCSFHQLIQDAAILDPCGIILFNKLEAGGIYESNFIIDIRNGKYSLFLTFTLHCSRGLCRSRIGYSYFTYYSNLTQEFQPRQIFKFFSSYRLSKKQVQVQLEGQVFTIVQVHGQISSQNLVDDLVRQLQNTRQKGERGR